MCLPRDVSATFNGLALSFSSEKQPVVLALEAKEAARVIQLIYD